MRILILLAFAAHAQQALPSPKPIARGADIGWLSEMESVGRRFYNSKGEQKDLLDIFKDYCIDAIRLRVWVNPAGGWSGKQDVVQLAKRAHAKGFRLMIDFHYSDSWADPGKQTKPAAWSTYNVQQLGQAVYNHTFSILDTLQQVGVNPEWVQIGNETNDGMLWPEGRASASADAMKNYANFVKQGHTAVKAVFPNAITLVHVANGYDNALFRWNIGGLVANGATFDGIAMSLYPTPNNYDSLVQLLGQNMSDMVNRYGKLIMVSEVGISVSAPNEGKQMVASTITAVKKISADKGLGVFWWEPQAYNWKGYDKVAWTNDGKPTQAMDGFRFECPDKPTALDQRYRNHPQRKTGKARDLLGKAVAVPNL